MNSRILLRLTFLGALAIVAYLIRLDQIAPGQATGVYRQLARYNAQYRTSNFFKKAANSQAGTARTWTHPNAVSVRSSSTGRGR